MMIHYLVYLSTATHLFTDDILQSILESSRRNNASKDITGLLLYHEGAILQVLEGEETAVKKLYRLLEVDPRHQGVIKVMEGEAPTRYFRDWSMGFRRLSAKEWVDIEGYLPIGNAIVNRTALHQHEDREAMLTFLQSFYKANFG